MKNLVQTEQTDKKLEQIINHNSSLLGYYAIFDYFDPAFVGSKFL
jgi:hypothetical protein